MPDRRYVPFHRLRRRLSGDFYLSLTAVFVALASAALLPFFIYRIALGQPLGVMINGLTLAILWLGFAHAWITGRTEPARKCVVVYLGLAGIFIIVVAGHLPYWIFPIVLANFMLVGWRFALTVNVLMVLGVVIGAPFFQQPVDVASFLTSVVLVGMFAMMFVINTNFHRDRLSEMVARDALTGAFNRRVLRDDLTNAIARSRRHRHPVAVALLDLDNFKQVNDTQGHEVGDQVLIDLTRIVAQQSRRSDRFYRLGGEEFVLLLDHTDRKGAQTALEKLMELVRSGLRSPTGPVTVSIGVAVHQPDENWSDWLARADQAMYRAKSEGKDRVVFAD